MTSSVRTANALMASKSQRRDTAADGPLIHLSKTNPASIAAATANATEAVRGVKKVSAANIFCNLNAKSLRVSSRHPNALLRNY